MIPEYIYQLKDEQKYDFRKRLDEIHQKNIRDLNLTPDSDEFEFKTISFKLEGDFSSVVELAVADFKDFMAKSMEVEEGGDANVIIKLSNDLGDYNAYKGYRITVGEKVEIAGFDERGIAFALYNLEDMLSLRRAPFIKRDTYFRKPMYSPMMIHSGYGFDMFPDSYLSRIVHEGRDAIMIFVRGINKTPKGFLDFNDVISRAARYGIDVYAYSNIKSPIGPYDEGAEECYDEIYGKLIDECPGFKGIILCGESVEFASRDPHVCGGDYRNADDKFSGGIPKNKVSAGWYPCCDYPDWLRLLQKVLYKRNPDFDIIFWSYNWTGAPEEARLALINSLPEGITTQATFEMSEPKKLETALTCCADYTISYVGPSKCFDGEAKAASKRGLKVYSASNTAGRTWDFGVLPYLPTPQQWQKRFKLMEKYHDECGLSGLNECHHYGMYPSFITKLSKWCFSEPRISYDTLLDNVLKIEFGDSYEKVKEATEYFSEGISYIVPSAADQYGAFRIGPSYPFCLEGFMHAVCQFQPDAVLKGGSVVNTGYVEANANKRHTLAAVRVPEEIRSLIRAKELFEKGNEILDAVENKNEALMLLANQTHFMVHYITTGINAKRSYVIQRELRGAKERDKARALVTELEALLRSEMDNAREAITYVKKDSRLGYEPSMEYIGDEWHIEWKLRQVQNVLDEQLPTLKQAIEN